MSSSICLGTYCALLPKAFLFTVYRLVMPLLLLKYKVIFPIITAITIIFKYKNVTIKTCKILKSKMCKLSLTGW